MEGDKRVNNSNASTSARGTVKKEKKKKKRKKRRKKETRSRLYDVKSLGAKQSLRNTALPRFCHSGYSRPNNLLDIRAASIKSCFA